MKKTITIVSVIGACAFISALFYSSASPQAAAEEDHKPMHDYIAISPEQCQWHGISTCSATSGTLQQIVRAPAKIVIGADQIVHVLPKVGGIVQAAHKNLGEKVEKGELLATMESKEMAEAKSSYLSALRHEQLAEQTYIREQGLYDKQITSAKDYQAAVNAKEVATIDKELSRQQLYALGMSAEQVEQVAKAPTEDLLIYKLNSPIAGQVIARHLIAGELLSTDHEVYVIADLVTVWAEINIFPKDRQHVKQGQPVTIRADNGTAATGTLIYLSPIINEQTNTSTALAEIDNRSGAWIPGSFVQAELDAGETAVTHRLPKTAIQEIEGQSVVFVTDKEGFTVQPITLGRSDEGYYEVVDGVAEGQAYADQNTFLLKAELLKAEAEDND